MGARKLHRMFPDQVDELIPLGNGAGLQVYSLNVPSW